MGHEWIGLAIFIIPLAVFDIFIELEMWISCAKLSFQWLTNCNIPPSLSHPSNTGSKSALTLT